MLVFLLVLSVSNGEFRVPYTQTKNHESTMKKYMQKYAPNISIESCEKGYCVTALKDIRQAEKLVALPLSETLTGLNTTALNFLDDIDLKLHLNLLYYKFLDNSKSLINAAVHLYPIEFDVPRNWTDSDINFYFNISLYKHRVEKNFDQIKFCDFIAKSVQDREIPEEISQCESWKWAHLVIKTRAFTVNPTEFGESGSPVKALFPVIDMHNHDNPLPKDSYVKRIEHLNSKVYYNAFRSFEKGSEVFIHYATLNSFELMNRYGFVLRNNIHDAISLKTKRTGKCRGKIDIDYCVYDLSFNNVNFNYLLYFLTYKDDQQEIRWERIVNQIKLGMIPQDLSRSDFDDLLMACKLYRLGIVQLYKASESLSLRDLRRTYTHTYSTRRSMILEYANIERLVVFEALKNIDSLAISFLLKANPSF